MRVSVVGNGLRCSHSPAQSVCHPNLTATRMAQIILVVQCRMLRHFAAHAVGSEPMGWRQAEGLPLVANSILPRDNYNQSGNVNLRVILDSVKCACPRLSWQKGQHSIQPHLYSQVTKLQCQNEDYELEKTNRKDCRKHALTVPSHSLSLAQSNLAKTYATQTTSRA